MYWNNKSLHRHSSPAATASSPPDKMDVDEIYSTGAGCNNHYSSSFSSFSSLYKGQFSQPGGLFSSSPWWQDDDYDGMASRAKEFDRATKQFRGSWSTQYDYEPRLNSKAAEGRDWLRQGRHLRTEPAYLEIFERTVNKNCSTSRASLKTPPSTDANTQNIGAVCASPPHAMATSSSKIQHQKPSRWDLKPLGPVLFRHPKEEGEVVPIFKKQK